MALLPVVLAAALLAGAAFYAGFLLFFAKGLRRVLAQPTPDLDPDEPVPTVSVIVPARNEENVIDACLDALLQNDYPADRFEVIVVDDRSTDATAERVRKRQQAHTAVAVAEDAPVAVAEEAGPRLRLVQVDAASAGHKQAALRRGIEQAMGEIIITTDADCLVPRMWLRRMIGAFAPDIGLVSGPVRQEPDGSLFQQAQALEFIGLVAIGAGAVGRRRPYLCNSANLAYRRVVFEALRPEHDEQDAAADEVLIQHLERKTPLRVAFCAAPDAAVTTQPEPTLRSFFHQRVRWATTGVRFPRPRLLMALVAIYLFFALLATTVLALPWAPWLALPLGLAVATKMLAERRLVAPACRHFGQEELLRLQASAEVLHLPYVLLAGLLGAVGQEVMWKDRPLPRSQA